MNWIRSRRSRVSTSSVTTKCLSTLLIYSITSYYVYFEYRVLCRVTFLYVVLDSDFITITIIVVVVTRVAETHSGSLLVTEGFVVFPLGPGLCPRGRERSKV